MNNLPFLKGVNLGGWLVLEKWMTPSLFNGTDAVDEFTFMQTPGAEKKLCKHHDEFITAKDFEWLSKNGINAVRIPIGYWILDGDGPYIKSIEKLDWAVAQAKKNNLLVLIDLHGAPGSQNGKDHSGQIGEALWFKNKQYRDQTIKILVKLAKRYKNQNHVFGLQMLNEPEPGIFNIKLRQFYNNAYKEIIKVARPGLHIYYHDAFQPILMSRVIRSHHPNFPVGQDSHWYHFFTDGNIFKRKVDSYFRHLVKRGRIYDRIRKRRQIIIGEWSSVMSEKILKDHKEKLKNQHLKEHGLIQMEVFNESTNGWFYWSYKTESDNVWNFRAQVENGDIQIK